MDADDGSYYGNSDFCAANDDHDRSTYPPNQSSPVRNKGFNTKALLTETNSQYDLISADGCTAGPDDFTVFLHNTMFFAFFEHGCLYMPVDGNPARKNTCDRLGLKHTSAVRDKKNALTGQAQLKRAQAVDSLWQGLKKLLAF